VAPSGEYECWNISIYYSQLTVHKVMLSPYKTLVMSHVEYCRPVMLGIHTYKRQGADQEGSED